ncbi:T9SS type A sorting domain-containing protein [Portibacter lacus]|nr:T9SS type A sorting domain-containing protein [Portibacter lacus]
MIVSILLFSSMLLGQGTGTITINQPPTPTSVEVGETVTVNVTYSASIEMDIEATIYQLDGNGDINWGAGHGGTWTRPTFPASAGSTVDIDINVPANFDPDLSYVFLFQLKDETGTIASDDDNVIDILPSSTVLNVMEDPVINTSATFTAGNNLDFTVDYTADQIVFFRVQLLIRNTANDGVNYKHYGYYQEDFAIAPSMTTANISLPISNSARGSAELGQDSAYTVLVELWKKDVAPKGKGVLRAPERVRFFFSEPVTVEAAPAVPVKLLSFTGEKSSERSVSLKWQTAMEINNDYFMVEKSSDTKEWTSFSKILGNGNSNAVLSYSTVDRSPFIGSTFYRLKQVDYDGTLAYSEVIKVDYDRVNVEVYPNPVTERVVISLPKFVQEASSFNLYDLTGKLIMQGRLDNKVNTIDLTNINSGGYFINVTHNNEIIHTQKLIKNKVD